MLYEIKVQNRVLPIQQFDTNLQKFYQDTTKCQEFEHQQGKLFIHKKDSISLLETQGVNTKTRSIKLVNKISLTHLFLGN